ncbi:MAG TPA: Gfo/Idh/MocA family oxidoreductase [Planctomycetota bacterium]|nr:Gfo/Idh/MocA family oxidoreductase [Planctomycetota bacterium]
MADKLNVGFIGSGGMANAHVTAMKKFDDVKFAAFCDVRLEAAQKFATEHGGQAFNKPADMFQNVKLDAVFLLLPPFAHGEPEFLAMKHKVPFFVEKPVGKDAGLINEISQEVQKSGILSCVGYMNRHRKSVQRAKELLEQNPAVVAYGGWLGGGAGKRPKLAEYGIGSWWGDKSRSGGQIVEQCTHTFDVARYLCGDAVEVFTSFTKAFSDPHPGYTMDDASAVNIRFKSGAVATLFSSVQTPVGGVFLNVHGTAETMRFSGWEHSVKIEHTGGWTEEIKGEDDIFAKEDRIFLDAVRSRNAAAIKSPYPDGAKTALLTIAAEESIRTGKPVNL